MQSRAVMVDRLPERATDAAMETSTLQVAAGETLADSVQAGTPRFGRASPPAHP
jgi:hypothetical protein